MKEKTDTTSYYIKQWEGLTVDQVLRLQLGLSHQQAKREIKRFSFDAESLALSWPAISDLMRVMREKKVVAKH